MLELALASGLLTRSDPQLGQVVWDSGGCQLTLPAASPRPCLLVMPVLGMSVPHFGHLIASLKSLDVSRFRTLPSQCRPRSETAGFAPSRPEWC